MRRRRLRAALLVVVAAALAGIGYEVFLSVAARRARSVHELIDFLPEAAQRIRNFRRVKMKDGRMVWEITAEDAQYYEKQDEVVVREPRLTLYLDDGTRQVHIAGTEGHVGLSSGRDLRQVTLRGRVTVHLDDMELITEEATYDHATDLLRAPGLVTIRGSQLNVTGHGMEVEVTPQQVRLLDDVQTVLRKANAAP